MDINLLVKVTARAWSFEILSLMHGGVPGRQAPLLAASGASRTAFSHSLAHLVSLGLLERNPGHGHPLRPEFRLTPSGIRVAVAADRINALVPDPAAQSALLRRTWTLPVLAVSQEPRHFSQIKRQLGSVTDRALSQSLYQLEQIDWLIRDVDPKQRPLRPVYQVANTGLDVSRALALP